METDAIECYYCAWATDDLQTCINHVVKAHGDKLLKIKTPPWTKNLAQFGMKSKNFGFIPNDTLQPGQYIIANPSNWTVTLQDKTNDENDDDDNGDDNEEDDHDEEMDIEDGISLNFLEKSLQNLSIDIEQDDDKCINSPLAKKAKCSTPLTKVSDSHRKSKLNEHDIILDEMIMFLIVFYCLIPSQQYSSTSLHHSSICNKAAKINLASDLCPQCLHILVSYCPKRRVK